MCEFCDANSKGEILSGKPVRTFEWQKTAGYKAPEKRNDFLEMFILKLKNDKKAGLMVDNGYGCRYVDIDYCMFCRKEVGRVNKEEIVQRLKFMADEIDKDIKIFEETHNFEHIYDYNVYSIKEFIDEFINIMNTMKEETSNDK